MRDEVRGGKRWGGKTARGGELVGQESERKMRGLVNKLCGL